MFATFLVVSNVAAFLIIPVACGLGEEKRGHINKVDLIHIYLANSLDYSIIQLVSVTFII